MDRVLVRFASNEQKIDALQQVTLPAGTGGSPKFSYTQPNVLQAAVTDEVRARLEATGAKVFNDVQFQVFPDDDDEFEEDEADDVSRWVHSAREGDPADTFSLDEVVEQIGAPRAWQQTRGNGATIVIVDTGIAKWPDGIRHASALPARPCQRACGPALDRPARSWVDVRRDCRSFES